MQRPIDLKPFWYVPLLVIGIPGALTSSARSCLPGVAPRHGVSIVLVFELPGDAEAYFRAYQEVSEVILGDHPIHQLTPTQLEEVFLSQRRSKKDVQYVPVAVFHEDAQEVIDVVRKNGPAAASQIASDKSYERTKALMQERPDVR